MLVSLLVFLFILHTNQKFPLLSPHSLPSSPSSVSIQKGPPTESTKQSYQELRQAPSPCTKAGQGIPAWEMGSKKPAHAPGTGFGPTARSPTKEQVTQLSSTCRGPMLVLRGLSSCWSKVHELLQAQVNCLSEFPCHDLDTPYTYSSSALSSTGLPGTWSVLSCGSLHNRDLENN